METEDNEEGRKGVREGVRGDMSAVGNATRFHTPGPSRFGPRGGYQSAVWLWVLHRQQLDKEHHVSAA